MLERGDGGPAVREVQARLESLGYWIGPVDGVFSDLTVQAVFAFQKANGLAIDGVVGPGVTAALDAPMPIAVRSTQGGVFEVDKDRQLLIYAVDGQARWVWNTSTGTEQRYTYQGEQLLADTPTGSFTVQFQVDGWDGGPLGDLYRPKYFETTQGIAVHGFPEVPPRPASHGCVRVTVPAMDFLWGEGLLPIGTPVMVYGTSPPPA